MIIDLNPGEVSLTNLVAVLGSQAKYATQIVEQPNLLLDKLNEVFHQHQGQPLMVYAGEYFGADLGNRGGCFGGSPSPINQEWFFAYLNGENFAIDAENKQISFPTDKYVLSSLFKKRDKHREELKEGHLILSADYLPSPSITTGHTLSRIEDEKRTLEVLIGEEEIITAHQNHRYLRATYLLGHIEEVSSKLKEEVVKKIYFNNPSACKEASIQKTLEEDSLKLKLNHTLNCGLHLGSWEFSPERGVTINGPEYLKGLCERYQIEIPK